MTMVSPQVLRDWPSAEYRRWFADEHHIFLQCDGELARAFGVGGDDRAVVAGAAAVHIQIAARAGGRTAFWRGGFAGFNCQLGELFHGTPGFKCSMTRLKISRCTLISS